MNNDNLPTKMSFIDKVKLLFSNGLEEIILQANKTIADLREQIAGLTEKVTNYEERKAALEEGEAELAKEKEELNNLKAELERKEADLEAERRKIDSLSRESEESWREAQEAKERAEQEIRNAGPIAQERAMGYANRRIEQEQARASREISNAKEEAAREIATAQAEAAEAKKEAQEEKAQAQEMKDQAEKVLAEKKSAGEITAGKGEEGALMTIFFEKYIIEATEKLKADIAELEAVGGNPEQKEKFITNYQANILGALLAYIEKDTLTRPETKKILEARIQNAIMEMYSQHPESAAAFTRGFICTKYEAYDGNFKGYQKQTPYTLDSFIDEYSKQHSSYFEGKMSEFHDPVQSVMKVDETVLIGSRARIGGGVTEFSPKEHFLPRTDYSSTEFQTVSSWKKTEKNPEATPSYSPDLFKALNLNIPEEYNPIDDGRE